MPTDLKTDHKNAPTLEHKRVTLVYDASFSKIYEKAMDRQTGIFTKAYSSKCTRTDYASFVWEEFTFTCTNLPPRDH